MIFIHTYTQSELKGYIVVLLVQTEANKKH